MEVLKSNILYISKNDRQKEMAGFFGVLQKYYNVVFHSNISDSEGLISLYDRVNPSVVLLHHNRECFSESVFKRMNRSYNIYWRNDERMPLESWYSSFTPYFKLFLTASECSARDVRKMNVSAQRLMMGHNPIALLSDNIRDLDLVFTGQNSEHIFPLSGIRTSIVNKLRKDRGLHCFGSGWGGGISPTSGNIYRRAKIGIAVNHYNTEKTWSNRMYQIMTAGALCIAYNTRGLSEEFAGHIVTFDNYKECLGKIDYYLLNEKERLKKAVEGMKYVDTYYSWSSQANKLIKIINENILM